MGHGCTDGCDDTARCTYNPNCPSVIFARYLKSYKESENPTVIGYNFSLIETECMQLCPKYDTNLDLDIIVREPFQQDEWWKTRNLLFQSLAHFGTICGFAPTIRKGIINCNRAGDKNYARTYSGGTLQSACSFLFNLKIMHKHNPMAYPKGYNSDKPGKSKPRRRTDYLRVMVGGAVH